MAEKKRLSKADIAMRKQTAKILFTKDGVTTQRELAERVGISEKTIGKWITDEGWQSDRASIMLTREAELRRLYDQFVALNDAIAERPKGHQFATPGEANTLNLLTKSIKQMETDVSLSEAIEVLTKLINFVRPENLTEAKIIMKWADLMLKTINPATK